MLLEVLEVEVQVLLEVLEVQVLLLSLSWFRLWSGTGRELVCGSARLGSLWSAVCFQGDQVCVVRAAACPSLLPHQGALHQPPPSAR